MLKYLKLIFLLFTLVAKAQVVDLDVVSDSYKLDKTEIFFIEEVDGKLKIEDLLTETWSQKINETSVKSTSLGLQNNPYWFQIKIKSATNRKRVLSINYPLLDSLEVYQIIENKITSSFFSGDRYPLSNREIKYNGFAFPVDVQEGENIILIRINSSSALKFPIELSKPTRFFENITKKNIIGGMFYGWILVMILYNFFLLVTVREKVYLFMCLLAASNGLMFLSTSGYGMQFFWPNSILLNENSFIFFAGFVSLFSALLMTSYLELKQNHRFLYKYTSVVSFIMIAFIISSFFTDYRTLVKPLMLVILHNTFFFPITTIILYRKGFKNAKLFLLAWTVYLIGTLFALSLGFDWDFPDWLESFDFLQFGAALEVLLFSLSLGDRINTLKTEVVEKEIEKIQFGAKLIEEHNKELEQKVIERTTELKEANTIKDKFFAIIAHDLRSSISSFKGIGLVIKGNLKRNNLTRIEAISDKMDQASEQLNIFLDNLLNWSFTQLNQVPYFPKNIDLMPVISGEIEHKKQLAELKEISLKFENYKPVISFVDENAVRLVVRNLLDNAIKFTKEGGVIEIKINDVSDGVVLVIQDSGIGMTKEKARELFKLQRQNNSMGTNGEKGSGLGLILCKEFIELNKGSISVDSKELVGTTINVTLPLPN